MTFKKVTIKTLVVALLATASASLFAADVPAEKPAAAPAGGPSPAKQAVNIRKAAYVLIGNNFKPISDAGQGKADYNQTDIVKRAERLVVLAEILDGTFPEGSNLGEPDSRARPEIWSQKADFDKKQKEFKEHLATLAKVAATETTASDKFKEAFGAVGKDCKGCHDSYRTK